MVVVRPIPLPVRCLNCGGDSHSLAVLSVIIAAAAFVVAVFALVIAAREHKVFMKQLRARARFEVTIGTDRFDGDVYETDANTTVTMTLRVGISNVGDKAAGETVVNVLTPASFGELVWSTRSGQRIPAAERGMPTGDTLTMPDGEEVGAQMIFHTIQRVSMRGRREVWFMVDAVPVPCVVPVAVGVNSDDLPEDEELVLTSRTFYIRRKCQA
jgi:hypothetical protein